MIRHYSSPFQVNTLSRGTISEFEEIIGELEKKGDVKGIVMISGKPDCFIAGADIG